MSNHITKSGVHSREARRLQRALDIKYTAALRKLESIPADERERYVLKAEIDAALETETED